MRPEASLRNPSPRYLRGLIEAAGLTQREAARRVGVSERMMRYYLSDLSAAEAHRQAPYPVQYALEQLSQRKADVPTSTG